MKKLQKAHAISPLVKQKYKGRLPKKEIEFIIDLLVELTIDVSGPECREEVLDVFRIWDDLLDHQIKIENNHIFALELRGNNPEFRGLINLPESIGNLTNLKSLELGEYSLSSIPRSFKKFIRPSIYSVYDNKLPKKEIEFIIDLLVEVIIAVSGSEYREEVLDVFSICDTFLDSCNQWIRIENNHIFALELGGGDPEFRYLQTKLPESIGNLTNLKKLELGEYSLSSIPRSFKKFIRPSIYSVYDNKLPKKEIEFIIDLLVEVIIAEVYPRKEKLDVFRICDDLLSYAPDQWIKIENNHIFELVLRHNRLSSLPETIGKLENLQTLAIKSSNLTSLPETIGHLINLKELNLWYNQLSSLPETIGQLKNLQKLDLSSNKFLSLPKTIGHLINLKELFLRYNHLSLLPRTLGQLKNLQRLIIPRNRLKFLPEMFGNLTYLQELDLSDNELSSLPETIGQLKNLQKLDLSSNKLSSLPETIGQLTNIEELNLDDNQLSSLPETIGQLKNLQKLFLSSNKLISLPETLAKLNWRT